MPTTETIHGLIHVTYSKEEWKTFQSRETVSGVLGHTFELPPPGQPPLKEGHVYSFKNSEPRPTPLDSLERGKQTRTGVIEARQQALQAYPELRDEIATQIDKDSKTRQELVETLAELPLDEENLAMRDLLNGYIKRLDRSLAPARERLRELDEKYGPQGTYRKDIAADIPEWMHSGKIYNEKLIDNVHRAKTVDELLEHVGKMFLDLKRKLADLPSDASRRERDEARDYALRVQLCFDTVINRLKNEFGWEGGDLEFNADWFAGQEGFDLTKELGYTNPADIQDAFLAAIAGSEETWPKGVNRNPLDIVTHFLRRTEAAVYATCSRLEELPEDYGRRLFGWTDLPWIPYREKPAAQASQIPQGKVSNPALINELADPADATETAALADAAE